MARTKQAPAGKPRKPQTSVPTGWLASRPNSTAGGVFLPVTLPKKGTLERNKVDRMVRSLGEKNIKGARKQLLVRNGGVKQTVECCKETCKNMIKNGDSDSDGGVICYG